VKVPLRTLARESWLSWVMIGITVGVLLYDCWLALTDSAWWLLGVVFFAVLTVLHVRSARRQYDWVATREERLASYRAARRDFLAGLREVGIPVEVAAKIDRLVEEDKTPEAARLILKHLPERQQEELG
jgi:hypothetical protein